MSEFEPEKLILSFSFSHYLNLVIVVAVIYQDGNPSKFTVSLFRLMSLLIYLPYGECLFVHLTVNTYTVKYKN